MFLVMSLKTADFPQDFTLPFKWGLSKEIELPVLFYGTTPVSRGQGLKKQKREHQANCETR